MASRNYDFVETVGRKNVLLAGKAAYAGGGAVVAGSLRSTGGVIESVVESSGEYIFTFDKNYGEVLSVQVTHSTGDSPGFAYAVIAGKTAVGVTPGALGISGGELHLAVVFNYALTV